MPEPYNPDNHGYPSLKLAEFTNFVELCETEKGFDLFALNGSIASDDLFYKANALGEHVGDTKRAELINSFDLQKKEPSIKRIGGL